MGSRFHSFVRALAVAGSAVLMATSAGAVAATGPGAHAPTTMSSIPEVVAIRAAHHPGYDRFVLEFDSTRAPSASIGYVSSLIGDFSGQKVPVPGRAVIRVVVRGAQAHTDSGEATVALDQAFALPNVMSLRGAGDFEGVVTLGVGLAKRMPFHVHRLTNPGRIAIDVSTAFARTWRKVYFLDADAPAGHSLRQAVLRPVPNAYPATGLLDRVFAGPTLAEQGDGLRLVRSGATGFTAVSVAGQIARLRLTGGCSNPRTSFTIADSILPTLRALRTVSWVKIYYPAGQTMYPTGRRDSLPTCLARPGGTCLYLLENSRTRFLVLYWKSGRVTGTTGYFYSEWNSVKGRLDSSGTRISQQTESGAWIAMPLTWLPAERTFEGWTRTTAQVLRTESGGGVPLRGQPCG